MIVRLLLIFFLSVSLCAASERDDAIKRDQELSKPLTFKQRMKMNAQDNKKLNVVCEALKADSRAVICVKPKYKFEE